MMYRPAIYAVAGLSVSVLQATAQDVVDGGTLVLDDWTYQTLYDSEALSVDFLFGQNVFDSAGEEIGNVEDLVMNDAGEVIALVAEVGGFWDIGDSHVSVPWDRVQMGDDGSVTIPVTEDNIADFDLFTTSGLPENANIADSVIENVDNEELGSGLWRASELMTDYVRVQSEQDTWVNFGYVSDLLIEDGNIVGTLVTTGSRYGPGTAAYPYWNPNMDSRYGNWSQTTRTYDLPILIGDAISQPPFETDRLQSN